MRPIVFLVLQLPALRAGEEMRRQKLCRLFFED